MTDAKMTQSETTISTAQGSERDPKGPELQPIRATYFNVTDNLGEPIGGLIVLLDRSDAPVRSELHLYDSAPEQAKDTAIRQVKVLLRNRYVNTNGPSTVGLELRILETYQQRETAYVKLPAGTTQPSSAPGSIRWMPWAAAVAGLLLLIALVAYGLPALFNAVGPSTAGDSNSGESISADANVVAPAVSGSESTTNGEATTELAQQNASVDEQPATAEFVVDPLVPQTNGLPPSVNSPPGLGIGQRVRIRPSYTLTLRSQPGATAGEEVGFMQDQQVATIVGGPYWTQGTSDTIEWWFVQLETGDSAWAAANTSQLTLLELAE